MNNELTTKLTALIETYVHDVDVDKPLDIDQKLRLILSESSTALAFIVSIEEEFQVIIDDDDISADLFSSFSHLENVLTRIIEQTGQSQVR